MRVEYSSAIIQTRELDSLLRLKKPSPSSLLSLVSYSFASPTAVVLMHHPKASADQDTSSSSNGRAVVNQGPLLLSPSGNLRQPAMQMQGLTHTEGDPMEVLSEGRHEVNSLSRGLYGGAIEVELPIEFEDISALRDVILP